MVSGVVAVVSAVAGVFAAKAAQCQARASVVQAEASKMQSALDRERRHTELTPVFEVRLKPLNAPQAGSTLKAREEAAGNAMLHVRLTGPSAPGRVDSLTVRVRNDQPRVVLFVQDGWDQAASDAHVWAPFSFRPGVDGTAVEDREGRRSDALLRLRGPLSVGDTVSLSMDRSRPPAHFDSSQREDWTTRTQSLTKPVKLEITAGVEGYEPWMRFCEVVYDDGLNADGTARE